MGRVDLKRSANTHIPASMMGALLSNKEIHQSWEKSVAINAPQTHLDPKQLREGSLDLLSSGHSENRNSEKVEKVPRQRKC